MGVDRKADGTYAAEKATLSATGANGGGNILIGVKADASSATGYSDASRTRGGGCSRQAGNNFNRAARIE